MFTDLVSCDQFSSCKCRELQTVQRPQQGRLNNDLCSSNAMKLVKVQLLPSKPCLFSSNMSLNSNSIYWQNFMGKSLEITIKHSCLTFGDITEWLTFFKQIMLGTLDFTISEHEGSLQFFLEHRLILEMF